MLHVVLLTKLSERMASIQSILNFENWSGYPQFETKMVRSSFEEFVLPWSHDSPMNCRCFATGSWPCCTHSECIMHNPRNALGPMSRSNSPPFRRSVDRCPRWFNFLDRGHATNGNAMDSLYYFPLHIPPWRILHNRFVQSVSYNSRFIHG